MLFTLAGCSALNINTTADKPKTGSELVTANTNLSNQIMSNKNVTGTQIYEEKGIVYGIIQLNNEVTKSTAEDLIKQVMSQMKVNYAGQPITVKALKNGKTIASTSFEP